MRLNQFAAMNMVYQRYSFRYFLESLKRLQINEFELWTGPPHPCNFIDSLSDCKKLKEAIKQYGMKVVCLTPEQVLYPFNIAAADKGLRDRSLEYFIKYIDMASDIECDKMLCCAGWGDYDEPVEDAWKRSVDSLWTMAEYAEKRGVLLAFEILQKVESNLVYSFDTTKRIMDEINHPYFKLCVDTVPMRVDKKSLSDFFDEFGDRICHIHLTDGTPTGHVPLGCGDIDVKEQLQQLDQYNYQGYVTLEIGDGGWFHDPEKATEIAMNSVKRYLMED